VNNHFALLLILSAVISLVFTFLVKYGIRDRLRYFFYLFACFVLLSILAGWLMYPFPI